MNQEEKFEYESLQDTESVQEFMNLLAEGLASGTMTFGSGGKIFALHPKGVLKFSLDAKRLGERDRLEIRISWMDDPQYPRSGPEALTIHGIGE